MAGDELRTALVVLATPLDDPEGVRKGFADKHFQADPVVGIAFAISGPGRLFAEELGIADPSVPAEYSQNTLADRLEPALLRSVLAVVITAPPDFGAC